MFNSKMIGTNNAGGGDATFNTVLYSGNGNSNGDQQAITGLGFQPDFVWIKTRNVEDNSRESSIVMASDELSTLGNISPICATSGTPVGLLSYDSDGFTVQRGNGAINNSGKDYVAWCWKFSGSASTNPLGSLSSTISANPDYGMSVVRYTGNQTVGATFGHGLNQAPEYIIGKSYGQCSPSYIFPGAYVWANALLGVNQGYLSGNDPWYSTTSLSSVNSTLVTLGSSTVFNSSVSNLAYCFHSVPGFSKIDTLQNTSTDTYIECGFPVAFLLIKSTDTTDEWLLFDNKRIFQSNELTKIVPSTTAAEVGDPFKTVIFTNTGFTPINNTTNPGRKYIYIAFADQFA